MTSDNWLTDDDDFLYSTDDDPEPDGRWRTKYTNIKKNVHPKHPYIMLRCSNLFRRQTAQVAYKYGMSREEWIRREIIKRLSEETGISQEELFAGGPQTRPPAGQGRRHARNRS